MSEESNHPTPEQLREARHAGFNDSMAPMDEDRRTRLTESYQTQDARREKNVSEFYQTVAGGNES